MSGLTFEIFTLFPGAVADFLRAGLIGKALEQDLVAVHCTNFRDFTHDRHRTVDDTPYGGGPGMVMKIEPVVAALEHVERERGPMRRILLTPSGPRFDQRTAERLARLPRIGLVCGRYEGIDDRVRERYIDECLSLGDFVLNGGEVAALAIVEAVARLCEGVLGNLDSAARDSFSLGDMSSSSGQDHPGAWLEFPQYTRPPEFRGLAVPGPLLAGDHAAIARWRLHEAWRRTWDLRPDLRPRRARDPGAATYLGVLLHGRGADQARVGLVEALVDTARPFGVQVVGVGPDRRALACRDLKELKTRIRRDHGANPRVVLLGRAADLPAARQREELLDLLAVTSEGDLSAPLIFLLEVAVGDAGDLTRPAPERPTWVSKALQNAEAAFAPLGAGDPTPLAQTPVMPESSGPQPVHPAVHLVAATLREFLRAPP